MQRKKFNKLWIAVLAALTGALAVLLIANFLPPEKQIEHRVERLYTLSDPQFERSLSVLLGPPIVAGNQIDVLLNGDQIFPAMLQAIRSAQRTITFETYIYWSGAIGQEFAQALAERARAGVRVHVLLDWVGSVKMDAALIEQITSAGAEVERYHEPHWSHLPRLNQRTHRKLLVIDGKVGFTGGVGIADLWRGHAQDPQHWRDTHFIAHGPVVAQMQAVFLDNWLKATGRVLHGEKYFPALAPAGSMPAQMFSSSPTGGSESMRLMYLLAITSAQKSIYLSSSYFVPDELTVRSLVQAAKRGVKVRIITPGTHIDADIVRRASRALWGELLQAGVQIAEYQPTMYHVKVMIVDELLVSVGSTNFDNRSFSINDEANLNVLHPKFAQEQVRVFEHDWTQAREVTLTQWQQRPWQEKAMEHLATVLRYQL